MTLSIIQKVFLATLSDVAAKQYYAVNFQKLLQYFYLLSIIQDTDPSRTKLQI